MNDRRVVSTHFPYLPLVVRVGDRTWKIEALLDTGFDGEVTVPARFATDLGPPESEVAAILADGLEIKLPAYLGSVQLATVTIADVLVLVLGDEPLAGRGISDHFSVLLDHGRRLVVEP